MTDLEPTSSDKPIYQKIAQDLADRIRDGGFAVGDRLPSERDLADQLGISRMTVRQAFKSLTDAGLIESRIGRGCFVARPKIDQRLQRLSGFSEDMARLGRRAASVILRQTVVPAAGEAREALGIAEGDPVVLLERVRLADAVPMAFEISWLPAALVPGILDKHDFSTASLYEVLRRDYGLVPWQAEQTVEADLPDAMTASALDIPLTAPVLVLTRRTADSAGHVIEFVRSAYRGDRYKMRARLSPPDTTDS
ncbi:MULTISPECIES: GntR family transcriptional regulator [Inquilinus]|uniref:GntR family transcriptional regulator n=1 Tax=Inquilinus ginsengisoli TaxID=363840 RepID=A0ABU1JM61_9PROT|nr:GntR family transcriptional regulator [Inquilinus ginsengisoli]MDR6289693.1 GntR family transcriptional regulator [Inquilinus ginsengisoli]